MHAGYAAYGAYARTHQTALRGASLESEAFLKAARLLSEARNRPHDRKRLAEALRFNQKLWTIIQADVSDRRSRLPGPIKAKLLSISLFMDQTTVDLIQRFDARLLGEMIDINRKLAS